MTPDKPLLTCPLCGTKDLSETGEGWDAYWVHEENECLLSLFVVHDAEKWNTRPAPSVPEWLPIDERAKNGDYYLVWQESVLEPSVTVCAFDRDYSDGGWWMCCDGKNPDIPLRGPAPKMYKVLDRPAAPENKGGK